MVMMVEMMFYDDNDHDANDDGVDDYSSDDDDGDDNDGNPAFSHQVFRSAALSCRIK